MQTNYNPDVLTCLANLSNDEVFTPPSIVTAMLDLLPVDLWSNPTARFLDPVSKSGVFLREMAKRLNKGLEQEIPDKQERINHILTQQLYGIAITELTSLLSRRSVYCSKRANGRYSICSLFNNEQGNIKFERIEHTWIDTKCKYCGASKDVYDRDSELETHAYQFIHTDKPEDFFKNMKFDVIIGNPPYQLGDGGNNASATPIYNLFIEQAKKLNPQYIVMIIPARWYCGGRGLESFRNEMLSDNHLKEIHDFKSTTDCFPGIRVGGGICYFLWDSLYNSNKAIITSHDSNKKTSKERPLLEFGLNFFIRDSIIREIIHKISVFNEPKISSKVFSQKPYGFRTNFMDFQKSGDVKIYTKKSKDGYGYVSQKSIIKNNDSIDKWKVVTSRSTSVPEEDNGQVLRMSQTFIVEPNAVVTESYVVIDVFETKTEAECFYSYVKTRFFRLLCQATIVSPDVSARTFDLVPIQDFNESWTDEKLYKKYSLTKEEIDYIDSMIRPMEISNE